MAVMALVAMGLADLAPSGGRGGPGTDQTGGSDEVSSILFQASYYLWRTNCAYSESLTRLYRDTF